jgi:WD repeat-containing protein 19
MERVVAYLAGEADGTPKDQHHLFRLYLALKDAASASKVSLLIARDELAAGALKEARQTLFATLSELLAAGLGVPPELPQRLFVVHAYSAARALMKAGDHLPAARLLSGPIARHLSLFPANAAALLVTCVIECHRAGLRHAAFEHAARLLKDPELRAAVDPKHRKKVEEVVRRHKKTAPADEPEAETPCGRCGSLVPMSTATCPVCRNELPFCSVTCAHAPRPDAADPETLWCLCPRCAFPAVRHRLAALAAAGEPCPMCSGALGSAEALAVLTPDEVSALVGRWNCSVDVAGDAQSDAELDEEED